MAQAPDAAEAARRLGASLDERGEDYAFGGAIALGYWAEPRGTVDVDLTLFLSPDEPSACVRLLQGLDCEVEAGEAIRSIRDEGLCRARYQGVRVDVFLPTFPFYELARERRARVRLGKGWIRIWSADVLVVFKMMFFRRKDIADVEGILRLQGEALDRGWIRARILEIYGERDPRIAQWDELCAETDRGL